MTRPPIIVSVIRRLLATPIRLSLLGCEKSRHDALRFGMYEKLKVEIPPLIKVEHPHALAISGSAPLTRYAAPSATITEALYPGVNILSLPYPDNTFDLVVTDQVLEHVEGNPFDAIEECRRVLKPGGIAVHATPFLVQIHGFPDDFWRFTPNGLALMCAKHSEILLSGAWGNRYLWMLSWLGVLFGQTVPVAKWHPYHRIAMLNEPEYPATVWVVARK